MHALQPDAQRESRLSHVQCFNVALERPLSEEQADTLTW